jgi:hypothetical protein
MAKWVHSVSLDYKASRPQLAACGYSHFPQAVGNATTLLLRPYLVMLLAAFLAMQQGLFQRVVPHPTGKNGIEYYIRAAEIADTAECHAYLMWSPSSEATDETDPIFRDVFVRLHGKTPLEVHRLIYHKFGKVLDLIHLGNDLPASPIRDHVSLDTIFPEYASDRTIARIAAASADAMLADGQSNGAERALLDILIMGSHIQHQTLIANLVGISIQAIALNGINEHLDRFSEADWKQVGPTIDRILAEPSQFAGILSTESELALQGLNLAFKGEPNDLGLETGESQFLETLARKSAAEKDQLRREVADSLASQNRLVMHVLSGPEADWFDLPAPPDVTDADKFLQIVTPSMAQALSANARMRTQLRLLKLHAAIQIYKWNWNALPDTLTQVAASSDIADPLSLVDFQYERQSTGYRLYSKGNSQLGEIEIRYRMPQRTDKRNDPPTRPEPIHSAELGQAGR